MADAITTTASVSTDQGAYDLAIRWPLRASFFYDQVADVKSTRQTNKGATVTFFVATELAPKSTPISETIDIDAVAVGNTSVVVGMEEYGNAVISTAKVRAFSMVELDPVFVNLIGYNAGQSMDDVARDALMLGVNVRYAGDAASRAALDPTDTIKSRNIRRVKAELAGSYVAPRGGGFPGFMHPDVGYDLREETGDLGWRAPSVYSDAARIFNGEIGLYEGVRFVETPRAPLIVNGGATGTDVYATIILGSEALAKAHSNAEGNGPQPRTIIGPVVDKLMRFRPISWYWLGGYGIFRQAAIRRIESASSIGNNAV